MNCMSGPSASTQGQEKGCKAMGRGCSSCSCGQAWGLAVSQEQCWGWGEAGTPWPSVDNVALPGSLRRNMSQEIPGSDQASLELGYLGVPGALGKSLMRGI